MTPAQINFYAHLSVVVMFVLWVVPIMGDWGFYKMALWTTFGVGIYTIRSNYGAPEVTNFSIANWRESLLPVQMWAARCLQGVEMQYILFTTIWGFQPPNIVVAIILFRRSLWSVCVHASKNYQDSRIWGLFSPVWGKLHANELTILEQVTMLELMLLAIPIIGLFTIGIYSLASLYMHVTFLKIRYHSPDQSRPTKPGVLHRRAWATVGQKIQPLLNAIPVLNKPVGYLKSWFLTRQ
eukprot:TRINITY_DN4975_c0_g1_i3.p1 TRINITY_DN4975_c0_g1~~TRINITY_DN4975_c0_g1_i3.p1  ORF type:complete len:238 (+),score=21.55 TRINITY_DN4975_c0_g1_i3:99-812(+)